MTDTIKKKGKIRARVGRNYTIDIDRGGVTLAESDQKFPVGIRVCVVGGVIVSKAGAERKIKHFEV